MHDANAEKGKFLSHLCWWSGIINWTSSGNYLHEKNSKTIHVTSLIKHTCARIFGGDISTEYGKKKVQQYRVESVIIWSIKNYSNLLQPFEQERTQMFPLRE